MCCKECTTRHPFASISLIRPSGTDTGLRPARSHCSCAFPLQLHSRMAVAARPAAVQRLVDVLQRQVAHPHRHVELAAELQCEGNVLVQQTEREVGLVVVGGEEPAAM